ncbi:hypothetical protein [Chromobacterium phragmitis]|uniref:hypothetical protein n=1 Tax=Chromobacterium phragmitis TaxID=2202141 RepID=UPI001E2D28D6|nr:hypothetical protein [Chromobacterium phragmitis]
MSGEQEAISVTIGKPFTNAGMSMLDGKLQPVPIEGREGCTLPVSRPGAAT